MIVKTKDGVYYSVFVSNRHGFDTEYMFNSQEGRKLFVEGYNRALASREPLSLTKSYMLGHQAGTQNNR